MTAIVVCAAIAAAHMRDARTVRPRPWRDRQACALIASCAKLGSVTEGSHEQTSRPPARNAGFTVAENSRARADERRRDRAAAQAGLRRRVASERRVALSGLAQTGTRRLDHRRVEDHREQSTGQVLRADSLRTPRPRAGNAAVEPTLDRHRAGLEDRGGLSHGTETLALYDAAPDSIVGTPPSGRSRA